MLTSTVCVCEINKWPVRKENILEGSGPDIVFMAELESTLLLNGNKTGEECDIVPSTKLSPAWE